jgi:hypothetical protein
MRSFGYDDMIDTLHPIRRCDMSGNILLFKLKNESKYDNIEDAYLDRMRGWEPEKYKVASEAVGDKSLYRVNGKTVDDVEKFLTVYNGYPCKLLGASENRGYDGYYYTYLKWAKIE